MRVALSAAALLLPLSLVAQSRDSSSHKPNIFYFGRAYRGEGPAIGVETSSGSVRDTLGVLVIGVTNNGPADKAGIEEGDRIASANGVDLRLTPADAGDREMHGLMSRRLARAVQKLKAGDAVELRVYHDGQYKTVKVTTVKASDLAMDAGDDVEFMPEIRSGRMLDGIQDGVRIELPDMSEMRHEMPQLMERIKLLKPDLDQMQRSIRKLKTLPIEVYDFGVHRI
ncbi:MAG TPA: PDZ domain-containing protein [Gemmatimonadaceae bacterium]|nr:PDZ domain-containing protein [Gemmatimonadaceae bacterium]